MRIKGYCNHSVCLCVCLCTSETSLVNDCITWYFGKLGFERHGIDAIWKGFSRVSFIVEKKPRETWVVLYAHARGTVLELRLTTDSSGLQDFRWTKTSHFFSDLLPRKLCFVTVYLGTPLMGGANCSALRTE